MSMFQNTPNAPIGITINLMSFTIPPKIICETDQVRVRITVIPDEYEQKLDVKGNKIDNCGLIFTFNITSKTEKLNFTFFKKTILSQSPIIGNASLDISDIVSSPDQGSSGLKILDIYYPIERQMQEQRLRSADRSSLKEKVIGQAKIAISFTKPKDNIGSPVQKIKKADSKQSILDSSNESLL